MELFVEYYRLILNFTLGKSVLIKYVYKFLASQYILPLYINLLNILKFTIDFIDETPDNCEIFLDACDGMRSFMECIQFKKSEIIRNMMGLLGNVAEVKSLRNRLCKNELIATFRQLLFQTNDGIEIPYNSAGVLVHMLSDGIEIWLENDCNDHDRENVIEDIETAIDKWDLKSERNINYRSFEPIFRLVNQYDNPICQRWSCWALANLTTVYRNIKLKFFNLLDKLLLKFFKIKLKFTVNYLRKKMGVKS
jgi:hypothetical protein